MKTKLFISFFLNSIIPLVLASQGRINFSTYQFELDAIKDYRIKIDGGCGEYKSNSAGLDSTKPVFVISTHKIAFFSIKGQYDYVYVKQKSHGYLPNEDYEERFAGQGMSVVLTTHAVEKNNIIKRQGYLKIYNKVQKTIIPIKGTIDYTI